MPDEIEQRLSRVEWNQERQEERLDQGAEAFSTVRQSLTDMADDMHKMSREFQQAIAPRPLPWKWLIPFALALLGSGAGAVWTLARYPDRTEFADVQKANQASHEAMQQSLGDLEASQATSMDKIDGKLDALLGVEGIE